MKNDDKLLTTICIPTQELTNDIDAYFRYANKLSEKGFITPGMRDFSITSDDISHPDLLSLSSSIVSMAMSDVAYFANGWENDRACKFLHAIAKEYGVPRIYGLVEEPDDFKSSLEEIPSFKSGGESDG